jgi:site-specific DNA-adenine methylase
MAYPGGKNGSGVYQAIINLMPPHETYVEPFLGGGAIMRLKRTARLANIGIDVDAGALLEFECLDMPGVDLYCRDALAWLRQAEEVTRPQTLVYCDPPYLWETRSSRRAYYRYEMGDEERHMILLKILLDLPCMVMISGYPSDLYDRMLADWRKVCYQARTRGGRTATECIWLNFPEPLELHDYRFLGGNFRQRERIKRRQNRWKDRLVRMDPQERYALMSVLEDLRCTTVTNGDDTR